MVKNAAISPKKFASLLKNISGGSSTEQAEDQTTDPIGALVFSFLLWESTTDKAQAAREKILQNVVDFNDLRVCMPEEVVSWIGTRYPLAMERCQRLRTVLRAIFAREHAMTLESISKGGKREAKKYIESLDGMTPYVAARVLLLAFDTHAIPADEQLRQKLCKAAVCDETVSLDELANWLTHHIKAGKGAAAHYALQAWVDERMAKPHAGRKAGKNGSGKANQEGAGMKSMRTDCGGRGVPKCSGAQNLRAMDFLLLSVTVLCVFGCAEPLSTKPSDSNSLTTQTADSRPDSSNGRTTADVRHSSVGQSVLPSPPGVELSAVRQWLSDDPHAFVTLTDAVADSERKLNAAADTSEQPDVSDEMAANALKLYARGKLALLDNRTLSAILDLQKAQKLDPQSAPILRELARAYEMEQQPGKARDLYVQLLQVDPNNVEVLFRVGISLEANNNWMQAVAYLGRLDRIVDEQSVDTGARMMARWSLASSLAQLGYDTAYIEVMQKVLAYAQGLADVQDLSPRLSALYRQRSALWRAVGDAHCRLGQFDEAQRAYLEASGLPGADISSLTARLVFVDLQLSQEQAAQDVLLAALKNAAQAPSDRLAQLAAYVGQHTHGSDQLAASVSALFRANPNNGALARAAASLAKGDERVRILQNYIQRSPDDTESVRQLLQWLAEQDVATAVKFTVRMCEAQPASLTTYCDLLACTAPQPTQLILALRQLPQSATVARMDARLQATMGGLGPAWKTCADARKRWPDDPGLIWEMFELAGLLNEQELIDEVAAASKGFDDAETWRRRAHAYSAVGDLRSSIEAAIAALAKDDHNVSVLNEAARCYLGQALDVMAHRRPEMDFVSPTAERPAPGTASSDHGVPQTAQVAATRSQELARKAMAIEPNNDASLEVLLTIVGPGGPLEDAGALRDVVRDASQDGESRLISRLIAQEAISRQQYEQAVERLLNLYDADPTDISSLRLAVQAWQRWGKLERADGWLSEQLENRPGDPVLLQQWVQIQLAMHHDKEALARLEQIHVSDPLHHSAARLLESLYAAQGQTDQSRALTLARLNSQPQASGREIELARVMIDAGDDSAARAHLEWVREHADRAGADHLRIAIDVAGKLPGDEQTREKCVLGLVEATLEKHPDSELKIYGRGMLSLSILGRADQKLTDLVNQALVKSSDGAGPGLVSVLAWRDLAQQLADGKQFAAAAKVISERISDDADKLDPRGMALLVSIVIATSAEANIAHPGAIDQFVQLATELKSRGVLNRVQLSGDDAADGGLLYTASSICSLIGDDDGAARLMQLVLTSQPNQAMVKNNLGYLRLQRGQQDDETTKLIEDAGAALPSDPNIADTIGWLRYKQGRFGAAQAKDNAEGWIRKAIDSNKDTPGEVLDHLGDTMWRQGMKNEAIVAWRRAAEILNDPDQRQQLLQAYRQLQTQSWGVLVVDPSVMYDRQYAQIQERVKAKLKAVDSGATPHVAPTFSEQSSQAD